MTPIVAGRRDMVVRHETALVKTGPKADSTPSKFYYRLERLWLTRWFRNLVRLWIPLLALAVVLYGAYTSPGVSAWANAQFQILRGAVAARPELKIETVYIPVGSPDLQRQILGVVDIELPVSALDVDLGELRNVVQGLRAVKSASVRFLDAGVLEVLIEERMPAMVWRNLNRIYLLDEDGVRVAEVPRRAVRSDLPLVVGEGADVAMLEAREIYAVLAPLEGRVLGLVRIGARRWDVALENTVIKLPAAGGAAALRRLLAMQARDDVLDRDVSIIDMRDENRMILRLNEDALNELRRLRDRIHGEQV